MTRYTHESSAFIDRRDFIHLVGLGAMGALVLGLDVPVAGQKQPNFIFMLSDDQGWDGLSVQMHDAIPVPVQRATFIRRPISRNSRVRACAFQRLIRLRPSVHQRDAACKRARVRLRTVGQRQPQLRPPQMAINSSRRCMGKISPMVRRQLLKC